VSTLIIFYARCNIDRMSRFILARLHTDSLRDKRNKYLVLSTLETLPKGSAALDEAYNEATKRIEGQLPEDRLLAIRAISWISYAQRRLTTTELCHCLAIDPGDQALSHSKVYDVEDVVSVCAGLVTVDKESDVISLVHYTTEEYFQRKRRQWNPGAQEEIAVACLTYLSFDTFRNGSCEDDSAFNQRLLDNAFFDYSARYWGEHVRPVQTTTSRLTLAFLCNGALADCATQGASVLDFRRLGYSQQFPRQASGLHLAARYGLCHLTEELLNEVSVDGKIEVDTVDTWGQTPLWRAAENGHEAVVKLLLKAHADIESRDKY